MKKAKKTITLEQVEQMLDNFWTKNNLPGGLEFESDNYGQIVIYTGMAEKSDGTLRQVTNKDFLDTN